MCVTRCVFSCHFNSTSLIHSLMNQIMKTLLSVTSNIWVKNGYDRNDNRDISCNEATMREGDFLFSEMLDTTPKWHDQEKGNKWFPVGILSIVLSDRLEQSEPVDKDDHCRGPPWTAWGPTGSHRGLLTALAQHLTNQRSLRQHHVKTGSRWNQSQSSP